jgi:tetratricopeptide (TPR) repeat protein
MKLADEMASCWRRGECRPTEDYLNREPVLWEQPEIALQLIYEEICLRLERGEEAAVEHVVARFPQWREQLDTLLECHRLLDTSSRERKPPAVGEMVGEFYLVAEMGRGAVGGVFLAVQPALADRPVVLKLTPCAGQEHLSLARLQHTHIVPLYTASDEPGRDVRILCMPYFGGASLARLFELLAPVPLTKRTGRDLLEALDQVQSSLPIPLPLRGPARDLLARMNYTQAMCWIGICLAEALDYAHTRGLLHLDLKPANVLLAADGTPMLLDFHLAREPLAAGVARHEWLGGTPVFMAPEQARALTAIEQGAPIPDPVDARADIYALGLLLFFGLGGKVPRNGAPLTLDQQPPQVSPGLRDILHRCLANDPGARYPSAATLADDLRRHLSDLPLRGVPNRSLVERWHKWRRRRPYALVLVGGLLAVVGMVALGGDHVRRSYAEPRALLREGIDLRQQEPARAVDVLRRGQQLAWSLPFSDDLRRDLEHELTAAEEALAAHENREKVRHLHALAERIRFASVNDPLTRDQARELAGHCQAIWKVRGSLGEVGEEVKGDLLDVVVISANLQMRLASREARESARRHVLALLDEAEAFCGSSLLLDIERARHGQKPAQANRTPRNAWEHVGLGRSLLQAGEVKQATQQFALAIERSPGDFWAHFYLGLCAYRLGEHRLAVERFGVCVALSPRTAACYYNRALSRSVLGETAEAITDYTRALKLEPGFASAALNRGQLYASQGQHTEARKDLRAALDRGADPATIHYHLAILALAEKDTTTARQHAQEALKHNPDHAEARELLHRLRSAKRPNEPRTK